MLASDGMKHWEKSSSHEDKDKANPWRPPYQQARSVDIEMTSYVLLTYVYHGSINDAVPIVKWIVAQRNPDGGFSSTQVYDNIQSNDCVTEKFD